ncbi:peptidoglycan DD-metalloendopeptidase family protein [Celerinatantimonas sp. MCCC 1A17872]|uniref:peptidoglycan DD-metalloendopeptidase family protein n=1 Tax=Celerinatantimonas sp. MCCC 1A17872 TaxID=3177514 RepID=UPI0038CA4920
MPLKKFNQILSRWRQLPKRHRRVLFSLVVIVIVALCWSPSSNLSGEVNLPHGEQADSSSDDFVSNSPEMKPASDAQVPDSEYTIVSGDTLGGIFAKLGLSQTQMRNILESDQTQALDTLNPGDKLRFWRDQNNLTRFQVYFNPGYYVDFNLLEDGSYDSKVIRLEGVWKQRVVSGEIKGSLYLSARKLGLTPAQIEQIGQMFKDKINFSRELRSGDPFKVVIEDQFVKGQSTGENNLLAVQIINQGRHFNAFLFDNGKYYDEKGQSLTRAFLRYPTKRHYRISSPFNLHRRHPVTGRIMPHYGTDFACPVGTKIMATGDGVVTRVIRHPYAGLYIVIRHGSTYITRYLHLSKSYVHRGQPVKRGQVIALSGSTGRVTGPHLHYEFRINNRPVNPMSAKIPMAAAVSRKDMPEFKKNVEKLLAVMAKS